MSLDYAAGRSFVSAVSDLGQSNSTESRTTATVTKVFGDEVWVRLEESDIETRCSKTSVDVSEGDFVAVTVTGGRVYVDSNYTHPSMSIAVVGDNERVHEESASAGSSSEDVSIIASQVSDLAAKVGNIDKFLSKHLSLKSRVTDDGIVEELTIGDSKDEVNFGSKSIKLNAEQVSSMLEQKKSTILINPAVFGISSSSQYAGINIIKRGGFVQLTLSSMSRELISHLSANNITINIDPDLAPVEICHYCDVGFRMEIDNLGAISFQVIDASKILLASATVMYVSVSEAVSPFGPGDDIEVILPEEDDDQALLYSTDYTPPVVFEDP